MNKAITMSTQPKWLVKILNGEKTDEIRKTMPKCELPIDVYLYCTKDGMKNHLYHNGVWTLTDKSIYHYPYKNICGKVVAKFTLNKVEEISLGSMDEFGYDEDEPVDYETKTMKIDDLLIKSCLSYDELHTYLDNTENGYAWHIDNLVIFDKPKELSDYKIKKHIEYDMYWYGEENNYYEDVKKAPQSWQYVYAKGE